MLFEWSPKFILGVKAIDDQHRKLVVILNQLDDLIKNGAPQSDSWVSIFNELLEYAQYHFKTEEELMFDHSFGGLQDHIKEHAFFRSKITSLKKGLDANDLHAIDELLYFLMVWLQNHILVVDRRCCVFLNQEGVV